MCAWKTKKRTRRGTIKGFWADKKEKNKGITQESRRRDTRKRPQNTRDATTSKRVRIENLEITSGKTRGRDGDMKKKTCRLTLEKDKTRLEWLPIVNC